MTTFELAATPGLYDETLSRFRASTKLAAAEQARPFVEKQASQKFDAREKIAAMVLGGDDSSAAQELRAQVCLAFAKTAEITSALHYRRFQKVARELVKKADAEGWSEGRLEKEAILAGLGGLAKFIARPLVGLGKVFNTAGYMAGKKGLGRGLRSAAQMWKAPGTFAEPTALQTAGALGGTALFGAGAISKATRPFEQPAHRGFGQPAYEYR